MPAATVIGAAVDYSRLTHTQASLRRTADAAVLAGVQALRNTTGTEDARRSQAIAAATLAARGLDPKAQQTVTATPSSKTVSVKLARTENLVFGGVLGANSADVTVDSSAVYTDRVPCVTVFEKSGSGVYNNSQSKLLANCGVTVNSSSSEAVYNNSGSVIESELICVYGNVKNNGGTFSTIPKTGCPRADDPLASLPEPAQATLACDHKEVVVNAGETRTLRPGIYCGKLEINGGTVTFEPGIYVIRDAVLMVKSKGKATGADVMLFLSGKEGRLEVDSESTLAVSAPKSGTYSGIVLFQSRNPVTLETSPHIVNSGANAKLEGVVYMPNGQVRFNSSSGASSAAWSAFFVRRIELNSSVTVSVRSDYASGPPLPASLKGMAGASVRFVK